MRQKPLRLTVFKLDQYECVYCGLHLNRGPLVQNRTIDHLAPLDIMSRVDMSAICHPSNLVTACRPCNEALGRTDWMDKSPKFGRFRVRENRRSS